MSPLLLLVLVIGGIASIAVLLHVLGMSKPRVFENTDAAIQIWSDEYPDYLVRNVTLSRNQHYALIHSSAGLGVVWPMGADAAARLLLGVEITQLPDGLELSLPDYTAPEIHLKLDPDETRDWLRVLEQTL